MEKEKLQEYVTQIMKQFEDLERKMKEIPTDGDIVALHKRGDAFESLGGLYYLLRKLAEESVK